MAHKIIPPRKFIAPLVAIVLGACSGAHPIAAETALRVVEVKDQAKSTASDRAASAAPSPKLPTVAAKPIFATSAPKPPARPASSQVAARPKVKPTVPPVATAQRNATSVEAALVAKSPAASAIPTSSPAETHELQVTIPSPFVAPAAAMAAHANMQEVLAPSTGEAVPAPSAEQPNQYIPAPAATPYACNCPTCPNGPCQSGARSICGVYCNDCQTTCNATWDDMRRIPWSIFGQGEYVGPARREHVFQYFIRVDDQIDLIYMQARDKTATPYLIGVGDQLQIESVSDATINREVYVQPDGTISLPQVGEIVAAGKSIEGLRNDLDKTYRDFIRDPQITVSPLVTNVPVTDVINAVDARGGAGGQTQNVRVTPEGTIQAPGIGSVYVQGLSIDELQRELEARYSSIYGNGLRITPLLRQRAPSYVFVGGEVASPGRYTLEGPTTVMQAIALAGGWRVGGNTNQIVVFRRDENWCLKATKIDLFKPLYGKDPCPVNDVWLRDNDLVLIPKRKISVANDIIELYFTRGVYSAFPINFVYSFTRGSSVIPITTTPVGP